MALYKSTAAKIVAAVVADPECQRVINWPRLISPTIDPALPPFIRPFIQDLADLARTSLELTQSAGSVRNALMLLGGLKKGDPSFDEKICIYIAEVTMKAILKEMWTGGIPELKKCYVCHRELGIFKVNHQATCVRTADDDTWYVFDWHATLRPSDPVINTESRWALGGTGINYVFFKGFN